VRRLATSTAWERRIGPPTIFRRLSRMAVPVSVMSAMMSA